jgi:intraflagellar transport protein 74
LDQVREDNIEIAGMERRISEIEETVNKTKDKIAQYDHDQETGAGMFFSLPSTNITNY